MQQKSELPIWKAKKISEKVFYILGIILAVSIIVMAICDVFELFDFKYFYEILFSLFLLVQSFQYFEYNKKISIFLLVIGLILLICSVIMMFL